jgi:hypothetical protein
VPAPVFFAPVLALVPALALALVASGCGSGGSSSTTGAAPVAAQTHSAPRPVAAAPPRLSILSPRTGAHTSSTLTVRVALHGAPDDGARFSYVLDHRLRRLGSARLTFHDLAPGHHRVEVSLVASSTASRAAVAFTVRAPVPVAAPAPMETTPTTTASEPPPITTTTPPSPSPSRTTPTPQPTEGIPQGGGGDGDGDNSGGPSDGDGNM